MSLNSWTYNKLTTNSGINTAVAGRIYQNIISDVNSNLPAIMIQASRGGDESISKTSIVPATLYITVGDFNWESAKNIAASVIALLDRGQSGEVASIALDSQSESGQSFDGDPNKIICQQILSFRVLVTQ